MIVLLKDAWTCAMPSETLFLIFLRTRDAPLLEAFAIFYSSIISSGKQQRDAALTGAGVGTRTLAAYGQATLVAHTPVSSQIDQTLDRQLYFATQITFNREHANVFADTLEFGVGQIFDLLGKFDARGFADFASASATNTKNSGKTDF